MGECKGKNGSLLTQVHKQIQKPKGLKGQPWFTDEELYSHYQFCLVMENTAQTAYVTEKILLAFLGGCITIYYGTSDILDMFNPQAFIFYNISHAQPALDRIAHLEGNRTGYQQVLRNDPILANREETIHK